MIEKHVGGIFGGIYNGFYSCKNALWYVILLTEMSGQFSSHQYVCLSKNPHSMFMYYIVLVLKLGFVERKKGVCLIQNESCTKIILL